MALQQIGIIGILALLGACHRVQEDGPALDADAGFKPDTAGELVIDVPFFDLTKEIKAETEVHDGPPAAKEACGNQIDDDLDGYIDEEGCYPAPNLRADQQWTDLGIVELQALLGPAPTRTYNAPTKNAGMAILMTELPDPGQLGAYVWAESLVSPSGVECISPGAWATSFNRAFVGIGYATVQLGMAPQVSVLPGPWKVGATRATELPMKYSGKPLPGWVHLGALARPELPPNGKGVLDLDVFCAGGAPMPCAQLATSPQWQQMAARINAIWKAANVELGQVEFFDIGGEEGTKFKVLDNVGSNGEDNELTQVYKVAAKLRPKSTRPALVLVSSLNHKGVPVATGLSQLAGIAGMAGARVNGMAVAFNEADFAKALALPADSPYVGEVWGLVIAHEIGHFLGLWHTDEADGALHDLVDDTPTCTKKVDVLTAEECPVQSKYLMFWQPKGATLTAGQTKVARNNPALRP
ncbi:MAG: hypothetical protein FJ100_19685 [Deltaproteobacteria bacterium]|nr:hypothetical protein [Deltaproteobacteria bacterium]